MPLDAESERLAEALAVLKLHGERAEVHVAERIGALSILRDTGGVQRWREIAKALDCVLRPNGAA